MIHSLKVEHFDRHFLCLRLVCISMMNLMWLDSSQLLTRINSKFELEIDSRCRWMQEGLDGQVKQGQIEADWLIDLKYL